MSLLRWLPSALLLAPWLLAPVTPTEAERIRDVAAPSAFRLLDWETVQLSARSGRLLSALLGTRDARTADRDTNTLRTYFQDRSRRAELRPQAEAAMEHMVAGAYRDGGVSRSMPLPIGGLFPPVLVALTPPPNVLVVAPRTQLRVAESSVLQAMDVPAQERLEASVDSEGGVVSLVAPIGGLATYPSMVLEEDSADRMLSSVAHEWLHQYLIFYPLGAGYWQSQQTREINETTADMVGQEVGGALARSLALGGSTAATPTTQQSGFDFRAFMRETRLQTESLLGTGEVDAAEQYMRARRDELQTHGYVLRKLNQAYFALYGSYGEGFAASPNNPVPGLLRALRERSPTLGDFVVRVRQITSVEQLRQAVG